MGAALCLRFELRMRWTERRKWSTLASCLFLASVQTFAAESLALARARFCQRFASLFDMLM
jgi:uncharacterized membrane protein